VARRYGEAIRAGKIPPMILVFPNGLPRGMWCDWKDGSVKLETMFISELMPHIDSTFRTQATREGRIIEGFSMGGYGAARLGFKHPHLFAAVSLLGAGPLQAEFTETPRAGPRERDRLLATVYGKDMAYYREQSPWQIVEQNAEILRSGLLIRQIVGDSDETLSFNREFKQHLEAHKMPVTYRQLPGVPSCAGAALLHGTVSLRILGKGAAHDGGHNHRCRASGAHADRRIRSHHAETLRRRRDPPHRAPTGGSQIVPGIHDHW
jgi:enterochelin esterase-like enzyme